MIFHKHLLVNAKVASPIKKVEQGEEFLRSLVKHIDMKILQGPFCSYVWTEGNRGLTGIVLIETSHIAFHIWDEPQKPLLQFDLYTCGSLNHQLVLDIIKARFGVMTMEWVLFDRENGFDVEDEGDYVS